MIKAAQFLGVAPWDLLDQPIWWVNWALEGQQAEVYAEKKAIERAKAQSKKGKR